MTATAARPARAEEPAAPPALAVQAAAFDYWSPRMHELHLRLDLDADDLDGDEAFTPRAVRVDGARIADAYWYFDGSTYDYAAIPDAGGKRVELYVPLPWRAGRRYAVELEYDYGGEARALRATAEAPEAGGVWDPSAGGNIGFLVCEEIGLPRSKEPVEFDVTALEADFPDPQRNVRATLLTEPGLFEEIPCQVYLAERLEGEGHYTSEPIVRFRTAVQLTVPARGEATVFLWSCPDAPATAPALPQGQAPPVTLEQTPQGRVAQNHHYRVALDPKSGSMMSWQDERTGVLFQSVERPGDPPTRRAIQYTPDVYKDRVAWSHASDWVDPPTRERRGAVFCETIREAPMPGVPEVTGRVTYRFYADRPEVRGSSLMRVTAPVRVLGFRNGGLLQDAKLFTHAAWPRQDGSVVRVPLASVLGNDTGSPPEGRMPWATPWVAFYHESEGYGISVVTRSVAYFNEHGDPPNQSGAKYYVSLYRNAFVYTLRAMTITYQANIRSYHTPLQPGTVGYEETAWLPFELAEGDRPFAPVEDLHRELTHPLVIVP